MLIDETKGEKYPGVPEKSPEAEVESIILTLTEIGKTLFKERRHEILDGLRTTIDGHIIKHLDNHDDAEDWIPKSDRDRSDHHRWVIAERKERLHAARYHKAAEKYEVRLNEILLDRTITVVPREGIQPDSVFAGNFESVIPEEVSGKVTAITGVHGTLTLMTTEGQAVTAYLLNPVENKIQFQAGLTFND